MFALLLKIGRERNEKPVRARDFLLKKASELGTVGVEACSLVLIAISSGESGEGGELERVVAELLFIDHRRMCPFRGTVSDRFKPGTASDTPVALLSGWLPTLFSSAEKVRRKLPDEPKVGRLEGGAGVVASWSGVGTAAVEVDC